VKAQISYGKATIPFYRSFALPLTDVTPIAESPFTGRSNTLFAAEIDVEVFGNNFMPAYTEGDNRNVVATDTMKNVVLRQALAFNGATLEGLVHFLGLQMLTTYDVMQSLRVTGRELAFVAAQVPTTEAAGFGPSEVLYRRSHDDYATVALDFARHSDGAYVADHQCGRVGLQLLKVTGSSFTKFARDQFTTLPERSDRPLFIMLDVHWRYSSVEDMIGVDVQRYIPAEQVRDFVQTVFHEFVSESIQHLIHEIGVRMLRRFPQMAEVSFAAQNHTPDPMVISEMDEKQKVYSSAFPAYGLIKLKLSRDDIS
jgi:urate oxidase